MPEPAAVTPEKILKDLTKLWRDLSAPGPNGDSEGVLRACAMTLIAAVDADADAESSSACIGQLMREHPSRAIILRAAENSESLEARVGAQCWMPSGGRQQICSEQIDISTPRRMLADIPKLLLALIAPDLPVVLWVRCPGLAAHPEFEKLFSLATKIIIDSECFGDPAKGYAFVADWVERGANIVDLAWTRLTPLRQAVSAIFDNEPYNGSFDTITAITIVGAPQSFAARKYLSRWFRNALPSAQVRVEPGGPPHIQITREGVSSNIPLGPLPHRSEHALLGEELGIPEPDPIFRGCFE